MILTMDEFRKYVPEKPTFALFGHPIAHTMSPELHSKLFRASGKDCEYFAVDVPPEDLEEAMRIADVRRSQSANSAQKGGLSIFRCRR